MADDSMDEADDCLLTSRVNSELEILNRASEEINRLENELEASRTKFRKNHHDSMAQLNQVAQKIKKSIAKARPFYEAREKSLTAQEETLKSARKFQSAYGIYRAAKETILLAEERLMQQSDITSLSTEWQEMLNHATFRVMEAEKEKRACEIDHQEKAATFRRMECVVQILGQKNRRARSRSRSYFELKLRLQGRLENIKQTVDDLQRKTTSCKKRYSLALSNLEKLSESVHEQRRNELLLMYPRQPGVGADHDDSSNPTMSDVNLDAPELAILHELGSVSSSFGSSSFDTGSDAGSDDFPSFTEDDNISMDKLQLSSESGDLSRENTHVTENTKRDENLNSNRCVNELFSPELRGESDDANGMHCRTLEQNKTSTSKMKHDCTINKSDTNEQLLVADKNSAAVSSDETLRSKTQMR